MNEQLPKEGVSIDDLKRSIEIYDSIVNDYLAAQAGGLGYAVGKEHARAEVWRTAANFIVQYVNVGGNGYREFMEGINLIREKLS